jgi:predicted lipoprotein with Yx(FWY)xxD motif
MTTLRRFFMMISIALVASIFLVACGGGQTPNTANTTSGNTMRTNYQPTGTSTTTMYPTPTVQATMPNNGNTTGNVGGNMSAFIHTAAVMLNGKQVHVLTTNKGFMLYYYLKDMMLTSSCTGGCAQSWPPLLAPQGMMTINSSVPLPKKLLVHKTANGSQVFYDGHALYTYAGDMQSGQFNGRGMGNAWYLVGVTL